VRTKKRTVSASFLGRKIFRTTHLASRPPPPLAMQRSLCTPTAGRPSVWRRPAAAVASGAAAHRRRRPAAVRVAAHGAAVHQGEVVRQPVTAPGLEGLDPIPLNIHGVGKAFKNPPFVGKVLSVRRLGGRDKERDVTHIVIDTGGIPFVEGQSFGVVPPGTRVTSKGEVPQHARLYSIASSRYGDARDGRTATLCVVRVVWADAKTGEERRGVCSNFLADVRAGDELTMTGPSGTALLLKEDAHDRPVVCVATGTGIAPFRSFWQRLLFEAVPDGAGGVRAPGARGRFWLLAGFANEDSVLYGDELADAVAAEPGRVRVDVALSLQQKAPDGGQLYVQHLIEANAAEFFSLLASDDALFYFCGLKRMYSSVLETLERVGVERGVDAPALIAVLKKQHRWLVETA
jgi:ferredoxin--NADP+ reductase